MTLKTARKRAARARRIMVSVPAGLVADEPSARAFARELPVLAAVKLYELGRLSSGRAAALAGCSRVEFLLSLGQYQVFPLAAELHDLQRTRG